MKKIGFIGRGNMGGALIKGVCKSVDPQQVVIFDIDAVKAVRLAEKTGCFVYNSAKEIAKECEYIVLAVKPQILHNVQSDIIDVVDTDKIIVSIAAGITLESLAEKYIEKGIELPVIRMMPNTPSEIGEGINIYAVNNFMSAEKCAEFEKIFARCGLVEKVEENIVDMATAVSGCTPAFAYMFIEALADGAVRCGVPRDKAIRYAAQAVKGAAAMVLETGRHPDELKDAVCSPGGSTIVGVATLENHSFRAAAANRVFYANEKNLDLGKK